MESKDKNSFGVIVLFIYIHIYIYIYIYIYECVCVCVCLCIVSSPYLLVVDNDRVRGTREQMLLQVVLVRHRARAEETHGKLFYLSFYHIWF